VAEVIAGRVGLAIAKMIRRKSLEMPSKVRGPFIEYECAVCGCTVQENADYGDRDKLRDRIVELNNNPPKRCCASCGHKP